MFLSVLCPPIAAGGQSTLSDHWQRPLDTGSVRPVEDLYPESCARCHRGQYDDWSGALHSKSVGPGLIAQLSPESDPQTAVGCYYCHAPLSVQNEVAAGMAALGKQSYAPNGSFDERLKLSGVSCAVCHVRGGGVFGPTSPGRAGLVAGARSDHASVQKGFFEKAEFCAACHQLDAGYDLNGKLLVNTYSEWKESEYGKNNIACQACHMPGRRHLFRGIHDPEMVKSGVIFDIGSTTSAGAITVSLKITNAGVGHYFPTYVTPLVIVKGFLIDSKGNMLKGTLKEAEIGRKVMLDLSEELLDTRIAPFKSFGFDYEVGDKVKGARLVFEVRVLPDEFYHRFFDSAAKSRNPSMKKHELEVALRNTAGSSYLLFKREIPLGELFAGGVGVKVR